MRYAHITGWGMYAPNQIVTNFDLEQMVETSDKWIVERTGIRERRRAGPEETVSMMSTKAARRALTVAGVSPRDLDMIIVATATPDYLLPATACLVQDQLKASQAGAFDLAAGCTGFIYGLEIAAKLIRGNGYDHILVIGAEKLWSFLDPEARDTLVLFGDGAGAVIVSASRQPGGILAGTLHADGSGGKCLSVAAGGSVLPPSLETVQERQHYLHMDGKAVFRFAVRTLPKIVREVCSQAGVALNELSLIVPHQANYRIIQAAIKRLKIDPQQVFVNVDRYGNTSAASIPIALCEALETGRVRPGYYLVFAGFGAGLTWGAVLVRWTGPATQPTTWWERLLQRLFGLWFRLRFWFKKLVGKEGS